MNTRLFAGLVSRLAFLRLNPPLMALLGLFFVFLQYPVVTNRWTVFLNITSRELIKQVLASFSCYNSSTW